MSFCLLRLLTFLLLFKWISGKEELMRLPGNIIPIKYRINIITKLDEDLTFKGKVWVNIKVLEETNKVILHCKGLNINEKDTKISLEDPSKDNAGLKIVKHETVKEQDLLIVHLSSTLDKDIRYVLYITYWAPLCDDLSGYFRLSYKNVETMDFSWLSATVFRPIEARRAFPCFDEPNFKARFQINLARKNNTYSLSSTKIKKTENMKDQEDWKWDHYEETPAISTHSLAFAVGQLQEETLKHKEHRYRVWARPETAIHSAYALSVAPVMADYLKKYLNIDSEIPKTDLVALPNYDGGVVGNWGLVTFGEKYLLYQSGVTSTSNKEFIALSIASGLAHTWFGNMVTFRWWNVVWLNDGLVQYFATLAANEVERDFDYPASVTVKAFLKVFTNDGLMTSQPLTLKTVHVYDIFDQQYHQKGFFLLRMLNFTLGEETFRSAVSEYINKNKFGVVVEDDLWDKLTQQASSHNVRLPDGIDVKTFMKSWTVRSGYPVVTVTRHYSNKTATVSQKRFLRDFNASAHTNVKDAKWWIPLSFMGPDQVINRNSDLWLNPKELHKTLKDMPGEKEWVLFNIYASGLYRVNYDHQNWILIAEALLNREVKNQIPVINRALLVDDVMDLAYAELLPYAIAFNVTQFLSTEKHYLPWLAAFKNFGFLYRMLTNTKIFGKFQEFLLSLLSNHFERLGLSAKRDDTAIAKLHRRQIAFWACTLKHPGCVEEARKLFYEWRGEKKTEGEVIPVDMRTVVYCSAIAHGTEEDWEYLWTRFRFASRRPEREAMLVALGCSQEPRLLKRYLSLSLQDGSGIKSHYRAAAFKSVANNPVGHDLAEQFLKENIATILKFSTGPDFLSSLFAILASGTNKKEQLDKMIEFEKKNKRIVSKVRVSIKQAQEVARLNIMWMEKHLSFIEKYLNSL